MIINPVTNIPVNAKSHIHGYAQKWAELLDEKISHKCNNLDDELFIEHGVNFNGALNLFGGANEDLYNRFENAMKVDVITSLDIDMPDYGAMIKKRIGAKTTFKGITEEWCDKVSNWCESAETYTMEDYALDNPEAGITVGDSHAPSFAAAGDAIFVNNAKTLHGTVVKSTLDTLMRDVDAKNRAVTFCFGSIDIRHHYLRDNNIQYMEETIKKYVNQAFQITDNPHFAAPVPVEYEGRKIPKTGWRKGTPFYGSLAERSGITQEFIELLDQHSGGKVVHPPWDWYEMCPEKYAKTHMELNSSFHIAPTYYRSENWGVNDFIG